MIEIKKEISGVTETITVADSWEEVYYSTYIQMNKDNLLKIENDLERTIKILASVSSDPIKLEEWLNEMDIDSYKALVEQLDFVDFKDIKDSELDHLIIDGRKFKIRKDFTDITWGGMTSYERLKKQFADTEDHALSLGVLLVEVDEDDKEKGFDIKTFDFVVNNAPDKLKLVDIYKHVNFFLTGVLKQSSKTSPVFTIKKKK